jgi:sporulation protein YlmC with PRC-barrel domain
MIKTLLASTALVALVSASAMAASHTEAESTAATSETVVMTDKDAAMLTGSNLASTLIGSTVYASSAEDAEVIGDINDIVVTPEGKVGSLIVGVGGFLGLGEKDVAVNYDQIEWIDRDGDRWLVANMSREQLEAAPAFNRDMIYADARSTEEGVDATQNMATGTDTAEQAPAEDMTAEKIESGESAVETAENKTMGIDRSAMTSVTSEELSADNLIGRAVYSADDDNIGEIGDVLLSADNKVEGFVLDVGGFLGMGEKEVAISPENLDIRADADGNLTVFTPFTQEQLEAQPEYSEETWKTNRDDVIMIVPAG